MFLHVIEARYIEDYKVDVLFNDGKRGIADLSDALTGPIFKPLKETSVFAQLRVDDEMKTIVWTNGADLAAEYIYFQAFKIEPELQTQFRKWGYIA